MCSRNGPKSGHVLDERRDPIMDHFGVSRWSTRRPGMDQNGSIIDHLKGLNVSIFTPIWSKWRTGNVADGFGGCAQFWSRSGSGMVPNFRVQILVHILAHILTRRALKVVHEVGQKWYTNITECPEMAKMA